MMASLVVSVGSELIKLFSGLWKDYQEAADAKDEAALQALRDKIEKTRAELTGRIKAQ